MTESEAKKIGSRKAIYAVLVGVLIAQLIMMYFAQGNGFVAAFLWFIEFGYTFNLFIGILVMLISAHYSGQMAGKMILIRKKNSSLVGIITGFAIILITSFITGWIGFFQEGLENVGTNDNPFIDYIVKPVYWVFFFGFIPVLIVGVWFGRQIKKHQKK